MKERPLIWRVGCKIQHTWLYRASWSEGLHRLTKYECNFCDATQTVLDAEPLKQKKHLLCELGLHEWDYLCSCYNDPHAFCARYCGEIKET